MTQSSRTRPAIAVLAVAGLALTGLSGQAVAAPPAPSAAKPTAKPALAGKDVQVTLITGDRVLLRGGDPAKQTVQAGPGREGIGFQSQRTKDHSYVIPADVVKDVSSGRLDRRLFDVTGLIKAGYDDASSKVIPVLATYQGRAKRVVPAGAKVTRQLSSINGAAVEVDKAKAGSFLATASGKIWLDGKRQVTLDQSVPQIGGPDAWAAGYTGKGVSVAVLDTGIDATHPDLATQVAGEKNFTTESADDVIGHGTHVASTIAGTGAASGGKYKGVAPDAKLYDGKICVEEGCYESDMLAGMEWAAKDVKAKVINFSIGGPDTPEIDPIEEAVNRLTAETGALFVIAAGNSGTGDRTIESPGSADAALTVGAVDKQDALAYFSSAGPRIGDSAVKPDVTAPGVDIVAAKSKDSSIGEPVGDKYLRLSGTSMATPHTAGAAAVLAQEHPSWKAGELKSALMGSAKVAADQTTFQQGAGRINLTTAIKQNVIASESSLSFGLASYPHTDDEPVTKPLTFRNLGDAPVTLNLATTFNDGTGAAAPADALVLGANTVTVPAGGTAAVQVTSNTKNSGPDGLYSGRITATGGGQTVVVPVGVEKEVESHTLTVQTISYNGKPSEYTYQVAVYNVDTGEAEYYDPDADGQVKAKLPKGEYLVSQFSEFERGEEDWIFFELVDPQVQIDADQTVVLDARKAKVVETDAPRAGAEQATSAIGFDRTKPGTNARYSSELGGFGNGDVYTWSAGPKLPETEMVGHFASQWGVPGAEDFFINTPYLYTLAQRTPGEFPTGYHRTVRPKDLAVIDTQVNTSSDRQAIAFMFPTLEGVGWSSARAIYLDTPRSIQYYVDAAAGWSSSLQEAGTDEDFRGRWELNGDLKSYRAGRTYHELWNAAAFGPEGDVLRYQDGVGVSLGNFGDASGAAGYIKTDSASTVLTRNGEQIATSNRFGSVDAGGQPAEKTAYKVVTTGTQSASPFATKVDVTATFTSAATPDFTLAPINTVRFQPKVDDHNLATRTKVTALPVVVDGVKASQVKALTVEVSGDGGTTWKAAKVHRAGKGFVAVFETPAGAGVSLRASVTDKAGNNTTQSVVNAYKIR
ncbi:S8 family serine peptidase [Kribbella sp. NPDC058245]|uniref:S8 family serine peptidase n=1 Tax=Kribbella sp. NPDC058245 TaxID=3346399 RepID=UPI0036E25534